MWLDAQEPVLQLNAVGMIYEKVRIICAVLILGYYDD